ncbi:hypothetical protein QQ045_027500 [Rhodiola kirilowii]
MIAFFFLKASTQNARRLKNRLEEYELISRQKVNFEKSEILFSRNVPANIRAECIQSLGVRQTAKHTKYLGLPVMFSHNRMEMFKYLIDHTWKRVLDWREMQLSAAGKEVMVKSILQSIMQYAMMCYKIPEGICRRLSVIINKFWWQSEEESMGIFWASKEKLCKVKEVGGMNFRNLALFNDALLAKQFWRILANSSALVSRVIKAKYFKEGDPLNNVLIGNASMGWKGIWRAGQKLKHWIVWNESENKAGWCLEMSGEFSTRSAYLKLRELHEE